MGAGGVISFQWLHEVFWSLFLSVRVDEVDFGSFLHGFGAPHTGLLSNS